MKIDIVYTWVDGSDPAWVARKEEALKKYRVQHSNDASSSARWMDNNELLYSLRSINDYAPWVNNIYIVTDNQVPVWLNTDNPRVHIINHTDIFPENAKLPVFNSMAIEANLQHIEGLSEHYIYFNDDTFLGNHTSPSHFFTDKGEALVYVSDIFIAFPNLRKFDLQLNKSLNEYRGSISTNRNLVYRATGKKVYYSFRHSIKSQLKSSLLEIEKQFKDEFMQTINSPLRNGDNLLVPNLFSQYSLAKKIAKAKYIKALKPKPQISDWYYKKHPDQAYAHCVLLDTNIDAWANKITRIRPFTFCISQQNETTPYAISQTLKFYESYFPDPSPFEIL